MKKQLKKRLTTESKNAVDTKSKKSKNSIKILVKSVFLSATIITISTLLNSNPSKVNAGLVNNNTSSEISFLSSSFTPDNRFKLTKNEGIDILNSSISTSTSISNSISTSISTSQSIEAENLRLEAEKAESIKKENELQQKLQNKNLKNAGNNTSPIAPKNINSPQQQDQEPVVETFTIPTLTQDPSPTVPTYYNCGGNTYGILASINAYRAEKGLNSLVMNNALGNAACYYSNWMNNNWEGTSPRLKSHSGDGNSPYDRCVMYGSYCNGEVLAYTENQTGENLVNLWKNSPSHNAILLGEYSSVGLGIMGNYVTADFQ